MVDTAVRSYSTAQLSERARRHLWMHFTRIGDDPHAPLPIIVSGEGCYVYDADGKRYLDGLSALYCVNAGHGRPELARGRGDADARARLLHELELRAPARDRARDERIAALAPGDCNRVFFTSGGSEAVESALKLARNYHRPDRQGAEDEGDRARDRLPRHLARRALGDRDHRAAQPFEPLAPGGCHVPNTNTYRWPAERDPLWAAEAIAERIEFEGPDTVAAVILEPVQNGGGCIPPQDGYFQRVREICDANDVLLISDEVICSWGRHRPLLRLRALRLHAGHHHDGEGAHLGERPDGRDDRLRPRRRALPARARELRPRLHLRRAPGRGGGRAREHRHASSARTSAGTCARRSPSSARCSRRCATSRSSATSAAPASSRRSSWSRTARRKETFNDEESEHLLRGFLSGALYHHGLICRADDRGDPVIQLAPPLIADSEQFEEIEQVLRTVLTAASELL